MRGRSACACLGDVCDAAHHAIGGNDHAPPHGARPSGALQPALAMMTDKRHHRVAQSMLPGRHGRRSAHNQAWEWLCRTTAGAARTKAASRSYVSGHIGRVWPAASVGLEQGGHNGCGVERRAGDHDAAVRQHWAVGVGVWTRRGGHVVDSGARSNTRHRGSCRPFSALGPYVGFLLVCSSHPGRRSPALHIHLDETELTQGWTCVLPARAVPDGGGSLAWRDCRRYGGLRHR